MVLTCGRYKYGASDRLSVTKAPPCSRVYRWSTFVFNAMRFALPSQVCSKNMRLSSDVLRTIPEICFNLFLYIAIRSNLIYL